MTISVSASDTQYGRTKANGREICTANIGPTVVWSAKDQGTSAGKIVINMHNEFSLFADHDVKMIFPSPNTKTISGTCKEESVNKARAVALYRRSDKKFVASTTSDATTGAWSFTGLVTSEQYFVVAFDDTLTVPDFDALIYDLVVPL